MSLKPCGKRNPETGELCIGPPDHNGPCTWAWPRRAHRPDSHPERLAEVEEEIRRQIEALGSSFVQRLIKAAQETKEEDMSREGDAENAPMPVKRLRPFTQDELRALRRRAIKLAQAPGVNQFWRLAYERLADAASTLASYAAGVLPKNAALQSFVRQSPGRDGAYKETRGPSTSTIAKMTVEKRHVEDTHRVCPHCGHMSPRSDA